jgi:hypothetical protein
VIAATAAPAALVDRSTTAPSWPRAWADLAAPGERHLLIGDAQLAVLGDPATDQPLAFLIPATPDLPRRIDELLAFWRALTAGSPHRDEVPRQRRRRLILGLRALDGRAAGASYRALAAGLFGADRVPAGSAWKSHDLRSRTLRLVADATALMRGGYRTLAGLPPQHG